MDSSKEHKTKNCQIYQGAKPLLFRTQLQNFFKTEFILMALSLLFWIGWLSSLLPPTKAPALGFRTGDAKRILRRHYFWQIAL